MFLEWLKTHDIKSCIKPLAEYHPYPVANERDYWDHISPDIRAMALEQAEKYIGYEYPLIRASDFMNFYRTGDRTRNTDQHFARRTALRRLVIGECVEHSGRFMDDIIDGIWAICEETFWGLNAHNGVNADIEMLPNVQNQYIDLFAGETAALLAWTQYLLHDELDAVSPMIIQRIRHEMNERIIKPYLYHQDFWWMGYSDRMVNNWTPWISSNMLASFLLMEPDPDLRARCVAKVCYSLDRFLKEYGPDGACNEGSHYWTKAGASLFDCLDELYYATDGAFDFFNEPLIGNIARYIAYCHICGPYYVNYADGAPVLNELNYSLIYRYGKAIGDAAVMSLGAKYLRPYEDELNIPMLRILPAIKYDAEIRAYSDTPVAVRDAYLADTEIMFARDCDADDGFFISAKGGHNAESHNHNDIGSCIAFWRGVPLLIDLGVETYSRKTFSPQRYEIWTMQSSYHNAPELNGFMQRPGRQAQAKSAKYSADDGSVHFSLDIAGAYPTEARCAEYVREYELLRSKKDDWMLTISDRFAFDGPDNAAALNFMTWKEPILQPDGSVIIELNADSKVRVSCAEAKPVVEKREFDDARLSQAWNNGIVYRIRYELKCGESGAVSVTFKPVG